MRLVQVIIPTGKREAVLDRLDREGIDYILTDETSNRKYAAVAYIPLPTTAVEPVLEDLREAGLGEDTYTVVLDANTVISRDFDRLQEEYAEDVDTDRIAREELVTRADELVPSMSTYVVMTVVSAVIATAGLLLDSPAVVVGSMVIAPLIGPAMTASVGTVVDDETLFTHGLKFQIIGVVVAVVASTIFGWFVRTVHLVPPFLDLMSISQVRGRLEPDFLSLAVALGAGIAGSLSLTTGVSSALVGVMIAVALIPPAATVGIGIAWGRPIISVASGILLLVNVLSINLAALVVLWYKGYRPDNWLKFGEARAATVTRVGVLLAAIVMLSLFLGGVTLESYRAATTEEQIRNTVRDVVNETETARVLDVEVSRSSDLLIRHPERVVVTVGTTTDDPPRLADEIDRSLAEVVGRDLRVQVRYVSTERS